MEDRSKRTETVRPQLDECCEKQRECDSVLSATNDENDVELNGKTDGEDTEDGEMGFDVGSVQVRNIRDPGQPTVIKRTWKGYRTCQWTMGSLERGNRKSRCLLCWGSLINGTQQGHAQM